jgi:ArsR family transcriptional regulator
MAMNIDTNTFFSAMSNEIRLRCLVLMQNHGELCVCELTHALNLSQPMISRHLALLRDSGLANARRAGQWIYYQINPDLPDWIHDVLKTTAESNNNKEPFVADMYALTDMPNRPGAACCA